MSANAELAEQPQPKQVRKGIVWQPKNVGDVSSLLAGLGIALYALGFVIWQIHLARFGAAGPSLFQARFISAGLCYVVFCTAFVLPSATIFQGVLVSVGNAAGASGIDRRTLGTLLTLWYFLIQQIVAVLLPTAYPSLWIFLLAVVPVIASLLAKFWKTQQWKSVQLAVDSPHFAFGGAVCVFIAGVCWTEPQIIPFVFYSLLAWALVSGQGRIYRDDTWSHPNRPIRAMSYTLGILLALSHTIAFSKFVFPLVPRQFGGGAPETAFLVAEDRLAPTLLRMGFQSTNEFIGPVEIVARDNDFLWISLPNKTANSRNGGSIQVALESIRLTEFASKSSTNSSHSRFNPTGENLPNTPTILQPKEASPTNRTASP